MRFRVGQALLAGLLAGPALAAPHSIEELLRPSHVRKYTQRVGGADSEQYEYWVRRIGDPRTDTGAIAEAPPRLRAREIQVPILLMHGSADHVVPIAQSRIMKEALEAADKSVRLITFEGEAVPRTAGRVK